MVTWIVYTSLLWAFSLLLYKLLFSRLRTHRENRVFLLSSLFLGLFLTLLTPVIQTRHAMPVVRQGIQQSISLRSAVSREIAPAEALLETSTVLWLLYIAGAALALLFVLGQAIRLVRLNAVSRKEQVRHLTIIRAPGIQTPFSFFRTIFLPAATAYSGAEEAMIIRHEGEHARLLHSVDVIVLLVLRIIFWFNPLVHLYWKQLRLLHEYQADAVETNNASVYGHFLLEQNMLGGVPVFAHSFSYSPLKNRIAMLLQKSTATRVRYTAALLLLPLFFFCCAWAAPQGKRSQKGEYYTYNGNTVLISSGPADTISIMDPSTGQETMTITRRDPFPITLNGKAIDRYVNEPKFQGSESDAATMIFNKLKPLLSKLEDGAYEISILNAVVDEKGRLAYYDLPGIMPTNFSPTADAAAMSKRFLSNPLKKAIDDRTAEILDNDVSYTAPIAESGAAVPTDIRTDLDLRETRFIQVKKGVVTLKVTRKTL